MATDTAQSLSPAARGFVEGGPRPLVIGAEPSAAADGRTFETIDPATGEAICEVAFAGSEDVDRAVAAARAALEGGLRKVNPSKRASLMYALADLIKANGDQLAELESLDNGKPVASARGDIAATVAHLRYYAGWPTKIEGDTIPVSARDVLCYTVREPVGGCAQLVPVPPRDLPLPPGRGAGRGLRPDRPVELPAPDGDVEGGACAGSRLPGRPEAGGANAVDGAAAGRARAGSGVPRGHAQRVDGRRHPRCHPGRRAGRRQGCLHRLHRGRP